MFAESQTGVLLQSFDDPRKLSMRHESTVKAVSGFESPRQNWYRELKKLGWIHILYDFVEDILNCKPVRRFRNIFLKAVMNSVQKLDSYIAISLYILTNWSQMTYMKSGNCWLGCVGQWTALNVYVGSIGATIVLDSAGTKKMVFRDVSLVCFE